VVDTQEAMDAIHRDIDRLEKWACVNLIMFKGPERASGKSALSLDGDWIESHPAEKDWRILVDEKLDIGWQCAIEGQKASCILGCIKRNVASRLRGMILLLYSTLVRP